MQEKTHSEKMNLQDELRVKKDNMQKNEMQTGERRDI